MIVTEPLGFFYCKGIAMISQLTQAVFNLSKQA